MLLTYWSIIYGMKMVHYDTVTEVSTNVSGINIDKLVNNGYLSYDTCFYNQIAHSAMVGSTRTWYLYVSYADASSNVESIVHTDNVGVKTTVNYTVWENTGNKKLYRYKSVDGKNWTLDSDAGGFYKEEGVPAKWDGQYFNYPIIVLPTQKIKATTTEII